MKLSHDDKYWPGGTQSKGALISGGCGGGAITGIVFFCIHMHMDL